jgi:hypothetical protein
VGLDREESNEMTRTIARIVGIAALTLVVAVPIAFGEGTLAGSPQQVDPSSGYLDAGERAAAARTANLTSSEYVDAGERGTGPASPALSSYVDANERGTGPASPFAVTSTTSHDIEWPQLGIGFGVGIALALGLVLAYRSTRPRLQAR